MHVWEAAGAGWLLVQKLPPWHQWKRACCSAPLRAQSSSPTACCGKTQQSRQSRPPPRQTGSDMPTPTLASNMLVAHGVTRCWPLSYASECERCFVFDNIVPVQNVFENTTPERPGHEDHECMHVWDGWSLGRDLPRGNLLQRARVVLPGRRNSPGEFVGHRHHTLRRPPPLWAHAQHCTPPTNPRPCHRHQLSLYCL